MLTKKKLFFLSILIIIFSIFISFSVVSIIIPISNSWANSITQIDRLHELGFDGTDVTIGIIDTGISGDHQDLQSLSIVAWMDLINHNLQAYDDEDHGTHITGILAAQNSLEGLLSGIKMSGIVSNAEFVVVKSIPQNQYMFGGGNDSTIADGIEYCIEHDVDIILLSMGMSPDYVDFINKTKTINMINKAIENGIFIVSPAGNDGQKDDGDVCFPGSIDKVISVGASSRGNSILSFSSKGHQYPDTHHPNKKPELIAPGDQIMSSRTNGAYGEISGTSQSAAYVTGVIALLLDAYPEYRHDGVKNQNETTILFFKEIFAKTAKKVGNLMNSDDVWSHDDLYGYGLIQAYDAYKELAKY